jgi:hypothetical protein
VPSKGQSTRFVLRHSADLLVPLPMLLLAGLAAVVHPLLARALVVGLKASAVGADVANVAVSVVEVEDALLEHWLHERWVRSGVKGAQAGDHLVEIVAFEGLDAEQVDGCKQYGHILLDMNHDDLGHLSVVLRNRSTKKEDRALGLDLGLVDLAVSKHQHGIFGQVCGPAVRRYGDHEGSGPVGFGPLLQGCVCGSAHRHKQVLLHLELWAEAHAHVMAFREQRLVDDIPCDWLQGVVGVGFQHCGCSDGVGVLFMGFIQTFLKVFYFCRLLNIFEFFFFQSIVFLNL